MVPSKAITVSQLNSYIKALLDSDSNLQNIFVCGEISNFKRHSSGHLYFSLKDDKSVIRAVMFASNTKSIYFDVKDGISVIVRGSVSSYVVNGQYQIYVNDIKPHGEGAVYLAFKELKAKLLAEGLFDESLKKPIPKYPNKIGVVTSKTGAVIHDIKTVIGRRYPICEIVLYPVEVQGEKAPIQIVNGINYFNKKMDVDVIIIGRGGGSLEELFAFNNEMVARAVFSSCIPIISAVGHETDVTICDFVADKRAPTPSAAAEIAVPDKNVIISSIENVKNKITVNVEIKLSDLINRFQIFESNFKSCSPVFRVDNYLDDLQYLKERLFLALKAGVLSKQNKYDILKNSLHICSPMAILKKGYAVVSQGGVSIKNAKEIKEGVETEISFANGKIKCCLADVKILGRNKF